MSVNIATMGMYNSCCGTIPSGGAPPYRPNEQERITPVVFVKHVEMSTINAPEDLVSKIKVRLKDEK